MRNAKWLIVQVAALLATGVVAAGCGGDDDSSSTVATPSDTSTTSDDDSTSDDTSSDDSTASTPDDVVNACMDVIKGTPAEAAGQSACEQAGQAFEQCTQQAESIDDSAGHDAAVQACQDAADQAVAALEAAG